MSKHMYESILKEYPYAIIAAINFYLVAEGIRPAYQYDYRGESTYITDMGPLNCALKLFKELTVIKNGSEPLVCLKSNCKNLSKCETMGEILGYRYAFDDWVCSKPKDTWFFGYSLDPNIKFFTSDSLKFNYHDKYMVYGYTIPKNKYSKDIAAGLKYDIIAMNNALKSLSLIIYPFYITLSDIYISDGSISGIPPL